ncbi:L-threonylcarbamoyladenylate synthase [Mariniflexile soesokkakense]|uniref:Threonylcarbamoyl-AMP synthase n=1 Tax=Mariniflexile soesokkakense TaxID=1343160 RepID=A0ABV0A9K3_9FLAO
MSIISKDISKAVQLLKEDKLVAIPTETVYGLAGNIYSERAISSIFKMKQRPLFNPLIVHIPSIDNLDKIVREVPEKAKLLSNAFWPGPLTLVLKKQPSVPDTVTAGKDTVAVRIPNHPVTIKLLEGLNFPLAAPSANPFGRISPTCAEHVEDYFKNDLEMVLDGGSCKNGIESTIVGFENNEPIIYRLGSISIEDIQAVIGNIEIKNKKDSNPDAPGMLSRHYAPSTPTFLVENVSTFIYPYSEKKIGFLLFNKPIENYSLKNQFVLSENSNLMEATSKVYSTLHTLDKLNLDMIVCETFPDYGLGKSINDRLLRATKKE